MKLSRNHQALVALVTLVAALVEPTSAAPPTSLLLKREPMITSAVEKLGRLFSKDSAGASSSSSPLDALPKAKKKTVLWQDAQGEYFQPGALIREKPFYEREERQRYEPRVLPYDGTHYHISPTGHGHLLHQVRFEGQFGSSKKYHKTTNLRLGKLPPEPEVGRLTQIYEDGEGRHFIPGKQVPSNLPGQEGPGAKAVLMKSPLGDVHIYPNGHAHTIKRVQLPEGFNFDPESFGHHQRVGRRLEAGE